MAKKTNINKPEFKDLYGEDERRLNRKTQEELGITNKSLAKQLKAELEATDTRVVKLKGAVNPQSLPEDWQVIATSGLITYDQKGQQHYGDGETLIAYKVEAHAIRQNARKDAHAQRGHYPTETDMRHSGEITLKVVYDNKLNGSSKE